MQTLNKIKCGFCLKIALISTRTYVSLNILKWLDIQNGGVPSGIQR